MDSPCSPGRPVRRHICADADHDIADNNLHAGAGIRLCRHLRCGALDDKFCKHRQGRHALGHDKLSIP